MDTPRSHYAAGITAALLAEVVFVAMVAAVSAVRTQDPWMVVRMPGALVVGPAATQPPGFVASDVALGAGTHAALGILVGVLYAVLLPRLQLTPVVGGLITGALLYALGFWILPNLFRDWLGPFWLPAPMRAMQAFAHAVYGLTLGVLYKWFNARAYPSRRSRQH